MMRMLLVCVLLAVVCIGSEAGDNQSTANHMLDERETLARHKRQSCRGVFDGKVKDGDCSKCPYGYEWVYNYPYCNPCNCQCGTVIVENYNVIVCKACDCNCGEVFHKGVVHCALCGCDCGTCKKSAKKTFSLILDVAPNVGSHKLFQCCGCKKCFPAKAKVSLESGNHKTMADLQAGDRVQTISSAGILMFSEVKSFLKKQNNPTIMYQSIWTNSSTISLEGKHLIFARKPNVDKFNPMYADEVSVDDEVLVQEDNELIPTKVINTSTSVMEGAFAPVTMDGNIIVDGVLASCYASFPNQDLAHIGMTPIRWFPEITEWIFGYNKGSSLFIEISQFVARMIMPFELIM